MKKFFKASREVLKILSEGFDSHNTMAFAGSIAFYMIFSLPGLLITSIAVAGLFIGQESAQVELTNQLGNYLSESAVNTIGKTVESVDFSGDNYFRTILGIGVLLFSATTVFVTLQTALNRAWDVVATPHRNWLKHILDRLLSLGMVICLGLIMLVSLMLDTLFSVFFDKIEEIIGGDLAIVLMIIEQVVSFGIILLIFMLIFKYLPDVRIKWKDVFVASAVTSVLFFFGKYLINLYIENSNFSETYQAAGSIIIILLWVYFSTIMILFGAELIRAIKHFKGEAIHPKENAQKIKSVKTNYEDYTGRISADK
ncbi:MAG: YihY/virulence factor BrkB family protein [Brumimicrobium sp.]|nr:YihY/virulence factor BrkB family protein [Brumimicrobium sp.]